jgi:hypothetical protein
VLSPTNQANRNVAGENTCKGGKDEQITIFTNDFL